MRAENDHTVPQQTGQRSALGFLVEHAGHKRLDRATNDELSVLARAAPNVGAYLSFALSLEG